MTNYRNRFQKDTIGDILGLFEYSHTKIQISMLLDDGGEDIVMEPVTYEDIKLKDIIWYLEKEVYSISAENNIIVIHFCDPSGEWK